MRRRYVTVDVFTDRRFAGNPLAVVLDAEGLGTADMQSIAAEFDYSETTFVLPPRNSLNTAHVRIFTPRYELPFAGHPNVGTAFALARSDASAHPLRNLRFEETVGVIQVEVLIQGDGVCGAELIAPLPMARKSEVPVDMIAECTGIAARNVRMRVHPPLVASVGLPFVIAELASREALRQASPDVAAFEASFPVDGADAIYLYTREVGERGALCDVEARMFSVLDGIWEDPATGSAGGALSALLASVDGQPTAELPLRISQGVDLGRPSLIMTTASKRDGTVARVKIGGHCVAVMEGTL